MLATVAKFFGEMSPSVKVQMTGVLALLVAYIAREWVSARVKLSMTIKGLLLVEQSQADIARQCSLVFLFEMTFQLDGCSVEFATFPTPAVNLLGLLGAIRLAMSQQHVSNEVCLDSEQQQTNTAFERCILRCNFVAGFSLTTHTNFSRCAEYFMFVPPTRVRPIT